MNYYNNSVKDTKMLCPFVLNLKGILLTVNN